MKGVEHGSILQSIDIDTIPSDFGADGGKLEQLDSKDSRVNPRQMKNF